MNHPTRRDRGLQGARHRARELALAALFRADLLELSEADALASLGDCQALLRELREEADKTPAWLDEAARDHALHLVAGVMRHREALDAELAEFAHEWAPDRMSGVDRTILRIALHELSAGEDVPPAVAVNEAVELAKCYGGADSARFVNGVLGGWLDRHSPPESPGPAVPEA